MHLTWEAAQAAPAAAVIPAPCVCHLFSSRNRRPAELRKACEMSGPPGFCSFPRVLRTYWDLKEEDVVSIYEKGRLGENISHDAVGGPHPAEREKWLHMFLGRKFWQGQGALELM